jgi:hypothetical protein
MKYFWVLRPSVVTDFVVGATGRVNSSGLSNYIRLNGTSTGKLNLKRFALARFQPGSGMAPGITTAVKESFHTASNALLISGFGTLKVDNVSDIQGVQFINHIEQKVLKMPVEFSAISKKCNLPYESYMINFYGKEQVKSGSYKVLVK